MFGPIGIWEMVIILVVALIVFGPRKLPELGRSLGKSLGEFKRASNELRNTLDQEIRVEEHARPKPSATATSTTTPKPAAAPTAQPASATASTAPSGGHPTEPDVGA